MLIYGLVALGGAIGSVLRYAIGVLSVAAWGPVFPWGTLLINVLGSAVIGLAAAGTVNGVLPSSPALRIFVMIGLCGGFTTFSSFSLQTLELLRAGRIGAAMLNIALSVLLCLLAAALGYWAALWMGSRSWR